MGLTTILRGFKIPVAVLDRFLEANGVKPTFGYAPIYDLLPLPGADRPALDPGSAFLHSRVGGADNQTRIFIPNRQGTRLRGVRLRHGTLPAQDQACGRPAGPAAAWIWRAP